LQPEALQPEALQPEALQPEALQPLELAPLLRDADMLIVVPPFAGVDRASLAAHTLQACARKAGLRVSVLYANLAFAREIGDTNYEGICFGDTTALLGERFFAAAAFGLPSFGRDDPQIEVALGDLSSQVQLTTDDFRGLEAKVPAWCDALVAAILAAGSFRIIGCSSTFEQTAASIAILNRIKAASPSTVTVVGGANCEGEMAEGLMALGASIDYIFSGESEATFPRFIAQVLAAKGPADLPENRIVNGQPCTNLDALPTPDFTEYFEQRQHFLPESPYTADDTAWLPYESSRGCWWGQKHHCTFCGINGGGMQFREKSADHVIAELKALTSNHSLRRICMVDNIMPHQYFRTLIPRLGTEVPALSMFYEQKANLKLDQVLALREAGVTRMQPGIEALSTGLLRLMDKGVTARQNVALLRYSRIADMDVSWNLLYAFPGDRAQWYQDTLDLLPLIRHLQPPAGVCHLSIDRFSPYHFDAAKYGVSEIRAIPSYYSALPAHAQVDRIAYHFFADYVSDSASDDALIGLLIEEVNRWRAAWESEEKATPALEVIPMTDDHFILADTRGIEGLPEFRFLTRREAQAALIGTHLSQRSREVDEAIEARIGVALDGMYVPLATAPPELLRQLELESGVPAPEEHLSMPPPIAEPAARELHLH
jgi:ribosomal peptide maturation radical SAM protein 1